VVHFRAGDYRDNPEHHPIQSLGYYYQALEIFNDRNHKILYFCDERDREWVERERILLLRDAFPRHTYRSMIGLYEDWEEVLIMSLCTHHIIANSTFSYWGAYLSDNTGKTCYPKQWFGEKLAQNDTTDMFPSEWIRI
jgi:hypothetical protein